MKHLGGEEPVTVPLKIDGVVVGKVTVDENDNLVGEITAPGTQSYLKELMLANLVDGLSLDIEYVGEGPENLIPFPRNHLHIAKEN